MSKAVKQIVGVVAAIAIPFAAPAIASAIGLSGVIGATLGSAVTGAGLGAISSSITGGDVGRGALLGAIGGGIGGYNTPTIGMGTPAPVYDAVGGQIVPATGYGAPTLGGVEAGLAGVPVDAASVAAAGSTPIDAASGISSGFNPASADSAQFFTSGAEAAAPAGLQVPAESSFLRGMSGTSAVEGAGVAGAGVPTGAGAAPATFVDALKQVPGEVASKFRDPKVLADLTLRAAGMLTGSAVAGDGLSGEERELLRAQTEELRGIQQTNQTLFNQRLEQAQNLIGESKYFDPEYFGLQRARREQLAGAKAKVAGLRPLEGARRASESRRYDLTTARNIGTAYDQGYGEGAGRRLQTMQAGLSAMPSGSPSTQTEYANLRRAYSDAETRAGTRAKNFGEMYGSLLGIPQSQSRG